MSYTENQEEKPFLVSGDDENVNDARTIDHQNYSLPRRNPVHYILFVIHAAFIAINVGLFSLNLGNHGLHWSSSELKNSNHVEVPYSPAHEIIQHEIQTLTFEAEGSPYVGLPRRELDEAWSDLLRPSMIDFSAAQMRQMNKSSVAVQNTGGYVGYFEVFHQLHCLKRMYQMNYPEHYSDLIDAHRMSLPHWNHCIEVIRKGLMCNPDLTVNTVHFKPDEPTGLKGFTGHERKCVNWDGFKKWADQRAIPAPLKDHVVDESEPGSYGP